MEIYRGRKRQWRNGLDIVVLAREPGDSSVGVLELQALEGAESLAEVKARAAELRVRAAGIMEDLHNVVRDLRPAVLDDLGLVPAIENYATACETGTGIRIDVVSQGLDGVRLAPRTEIALYRAIQEGLTNVIKHAQARCVSVLVERREESVVAVVEDDGCGFDPAQRKETPGRGLGLVGIAERSALLGGASVVESRPGGGTTLVVTLPWAGVE